MSTTVIKTLLVGGCFLGLTALSACSSSVSEYGDAEYVDNPYTQPCMKTVQYVNNEMYGYGQEDYASQSGEKWGPLCPKTGEDLSYMTVGYDVAISTPVPNTHSGEYSQMDMARMDLCNNAPYGSAPQRVASQGYVAPAMPAPVMPAPQVAPVMPAPVASSPAPQIVVQPMGMGGQGNYNNMMASSQPVNGALPVKGIISGANNSGYLVLDCTGSFISNSHCQSVNVPNIQVNTGNMNNNHMNAGVIDTNYGSAEDWVASEGVSLRALLEEWGDRAGWRVIWNSDREYIVEAGAIFRGKYMDVASALIRAFARANPAPQGTFYKGNKVLVINTQEAENAE